MAGLIVFGFVVIVILLVKAFSGQSTTQQLALQSSGIPARGLVLAASRQSTGVLMNGSRYERRQMTLDVEIPGRAPYVAQGFFLCPRAVVEIIPGASLELSVDPNNGNQIMVLGPGGFTGPWLRSGPPNAY